MSGPGRLATGLIWALALVLGLGLNAGLGYGAFRALSGIAAPGAKPTALPAPDLPEGRIVLDRSPAPPPPPPPPPVAAAFPQRTEAEMFAEAHSALLPGIGFITAEDAEHLAAREAEAAAAILGAEPGAIAPAPDPEPVAEPAEEPVAPPAPEPEPEPAPATPAPAPAPAVVGSAPAAASDLLGFTTASQAEALAASAAEATRLTLGAAAGREALATALAGADTGPCFAVLLPSAASEAEAGGILAFGEPAGGMAVLPGSLADEAALIRHEVTPAQCPALAYLRAAAAYPGFGLTIRLDAEEIRSGGALAGRITGMPPGGALHLVLIDDAGLAQRLDAFLVADAEGGARFDIPLTLQGQPVASAQLLLALAAPAPVPALQVLTAAAAQPLFAALPAPGPDIDLALVAFRLR